MRLGLRVFRVPRVKAFGFRVFRFRVIGAFGVQDVLGLV